VDFGRYDKAVAEILHFSLFYVIIPIIHRKIEEIAMKKLFALLWICALCVGLLLYNLVCYECKKPSVEEHSAASTQTGNSTNPELTRPKAQVRIRIADAEDRAAWEQIAADYQAATDLEVVLLDDTDQRQPTLFLVDDPESVDPALYQDLSGTVACAQLADMGLTLRAEEKVYGIAADVECFGLIYNESLLAQVATPDEVVDIASFSTLVQNLALKGYTVFAGRGLNDGVAVRLASMPGKIRSLAGLWVEYASKASEESALERFLSGESVFYLGSTDEYDAITAAGIDRLGILPVFQDVHEDVSVQQSLCVSAKSYWCVGGDAQEAAAATAFLDYLLTSTDDGQIPADALKMLAPYRQAAYCANPLEEVLRRDVAAGKSLLVCETVEQAPDGFVDALTAYAENPTDENWQKVEDILNP
jgi:hypothetical protein